MKLLSPNIDLEDFFHRLEEASERVLMLDYDGTLAPFRVDRNEAIPYPGIREILKKIQGAERVRLVIVSGRSIEDLVPLLGLEDPPEIWGCHGWEHRLADGTMAPMELPNGALDGLKEARAFADENGLSDRLEIKPASVAVHWRGLADDKAASIRDSANAGWEPIAKKFSLAIHNFDGGIEIRVPGRDKGDAITTILGSSNDGAVSAYLGDDLTDEDAFKALKGRGLSILVRDSERPTEADVWIEPPVELMDFLNRWADVVGGKG